MSLTLKPITRENFDAVIDLQLLDHQAHYLASNAYSIAQASFFPHYKTRAIYAAGELVGFLMYVSRKEEGSPGEYGIWRFMIDARHQGKGYGRRALQLAIDEIQSNIDAERISTCYFPENPIAKDFYGSFGFVETGIDEDGEMNAEIRL
ncbi:GNAT family N-acetyltransferase [Chitinimonas sp. BJB300]|uniref:GNAT family N-acetyltransferase n=1 Tax=Chitinimonas sp. BJB300 TaxID=1559339 RepID=UPI000C0C8C17|nr:GNAT family N-acetyltransferase [Chitinimonas sp. BJB300]PHV13036.1 GNAT family N-acetyltransferase [Chitinimonas sp. BJB300]TSJ87756.1 GNAT family N-acetyltransferase [Chitinimonas sp. BJB300]